ncbi:DUF1190 domain-containing protein [Altericroceibacterium xinjiangense]|uniref:DUF1190 domain-containing protein n=1 Tax=Altericroceibacterium xinjiangense TaxID=762261 RepID=UPI000F7DB984|nr:DUF1190 domain-containing protein [Altericroceibacterium xinjiangense]
MSDKPPARRFSSRKRSRLALGSIAAAGMSLGLSGCEDQPAEPLRFSSVEQCITAGYERPFCESSQQAALAEYRETAPRYTTAAECEAEWGAAGCERPPGGGSVFMPLLTGFLVGQALNQGGNRSYYNYGGAGYYGSPIYRNRTGQAVTLTPGTGLAPPKATPVNVGTTTVARSGFGGRGMARGGYGFGG